MADLSIVKVVASGPGYTTVLASDGNQYNVQGTAAWRNNNPGNLRPGSLTNNLGAVGVSDTGSNGQFLVFPDRPTGQHAQEALQFETPLYANKTIQQAVRTYAPSGDHNDPDAYAARLAAALGVPVTTKMSELTPSQRQTYLQAQHAVENNRPGTITGPQGVPVPDAVKALFSGGIPRPPEGLPTDPMHAGISLAGYGAPWVPLPAPAPLIPKSTAAFAGMPTAAMYGQNRLVPGHVTPAPTDFTTADVGAPTSLSQYGVPKVNLAAGLSAANGATPSPIRAGQSMSGGATPAPSLAGSVQMAAARPSSVPVPPSNLQLLNPLSAGLAMAKPALPTLPHAVPSVAGGALGAMPPSVPQSGNPLGNIFGNMGNGLGTAFAYAGNGINTAKDAIAAKAPQIEAAMIPAIMGSVAGRTAVIDPFIQHLFNGNGAYRQYARPSAPPPVPQQHPLFSGGGLFGSLFNSAPRPSQQAGQPIPSVPQAGAITYTPAPANYVAPAGSPNASFEQQFGQGSLTQSMKDSSRWNTGY